MKLWKKILLGVVVLVLALAGYGLVTVRSLDVEQLTDDLFVMRGLGGNTAVLRTSAGAVVVDTMTLPLQGSRIRALASELTGMDTVLIINTHYHLDHTHGNPAFEAGTRVISTERTLSYLQTLDADFWTGDAARLLPNETFADRLRLQVGGKTLDLYHPGRGHTDGDLVVVFVDEAVLHTGDLLFNGHYPNIDLEAGGTIEAWPATLDKVAAMAFDRVIPGHGPTTDRAGIAQFQDFLRQLWEIGQAAAASGASKQETEASTALTADAGYEPIRFFSVSLGLDRPFVLRRAWEEATGNFTRQN